MSDRYSHHYRILGIGPEASWTELRQAYKSLVNVWHPDRFQQDARRRKSAEEKTKEITQSYKALAEYYKTHGALPHVFEAPEESPAPEEAAPACTADAVAEPEIPDADLRAAEQPTRKRFKMPSALTAVAVTGTAYFLLQIAMWEHANNPAPDNKPNETSATHPAGPRQNEDVKDEPVKNEKFFTVGTSLGEVYAIQGVPTKTENDVWYYGLSKVYFASGKVVRWEENPDNPLRTTLNPKDEKMRSQFFSRGSSKSEVLAVQGSPDQDGGDVWDYGTSRVYFDNGYVKGWDESLLNPLKVRH